MYAPVCVTAYNRPEHFKKTITSLQANYLACETELFVLSNAAITKEDDKKVNDIREYSLNITGFKQVYLIKNSINKGETEHVIKNITNIINEYKRIISIDDDIITTKNFLNYMNNALDYYKTNKSIFSIGGFSLPVASDINSNDVYLLPRPCSWGWAMWADRWMNIKWNIGKDELKNINWFKYNIAGYDSYNMVKDYAAGNEDAFDIAWQYTMYTNNLLTVHPKKGFVINIGLDGSGERCGKTNRYKPVLINEEKVNFQFTNDLVIDEKTVKQFRKYWGKSFSVHGNFLIYYIGYKMPFFFILYRKFKYFIKNIKKNRGNV